LFEKELKTIYKICESRVERKIVKILDLASILKDDQVFFTFHPLVPKTFGRGKKGEKVEKYTNLKEIFQPLIRIKY